MPLKKVRTLKGMPRSKTGDKYLLIKESGSKWIVIQLPKRSKKILIRRK